MPDDSTSLRGQGLPASVPSRVRRRRWPWALAGLAVAAGLAYGWVSWRGTAPPPAPPTASTTAAPPPALTVALAVAEWRDVSRTVVGDGSVVPWQELVIGAEAGGLRVTAVPIEEGDRVRQGQLLVALDDALPTAQRAQSEAAHAEAEAALSIARMDLRRSSELSRTGNVSREVFDQRQSMVQQAEARLLAAEARRQEAAARLAQTRILAPEAGIVMRRSVLPGAVVQPGQEMARLVRDGRLELDARVPELDLVGLTPGEMVRVTHGERAIEARIRAISPVVAGETRLGIVHVALPEDAGLRPGMFARAEIHPEPRPMLTVPQEAVVFRSGQPVVFILAEGTDRVARRDVVAGERRDGMVAVTEGLRPGERVVVAGAGFLSDGDRVRVAGPR